MKENNVYDKRVHEAILDLTGGAATEKPMPLNLSGCFEIAGGLVQVEGFALVMSSTLAIVKIKATVTGKSNTLTTVNVGDVLTETDLTMENRRNCCPM